MSHIAVVGLALMIVAIVSPPVWGQVNPDIHIVKNADSTSACESTGITYTYTVTNPGDVPLENVVVVDDNGTPGDNSPESDDDFSPVLVGGDTSGVGLLDPDETWTYTATRTPPVGTRTNTAEASGDFVTDVGTTTVTSEDDASVVINPNPDCTITADPPCPNSTGNTACVPDAGLGATYEWLLEGGMIIDGEGERCVTYTAGPSGDVVIAVIVTTDDGCFCKGGVVLEIGSDLDCTITGGIENLCQGETTTWCGPANMDTYSWTASGGGVIPAGQADDACITIGTAGQYCLVITDNGCTGTCCRTLTTVNCPPPPPPPSGCRVTGGGNNEVNGNRYTFGGQAGAPLTGCCPSAQPWGEWTHTQHSGPLGIFTFHAGTASAPEGTMITCIECSDPPVCPHAAANGHFKQIDFRGIGTIKNIRTSPPGCTLTNGPLYAFEVHMEDLGEPGSPNDPEPELCPPGGASGAGADCTCPDFYRIKIHCDDTFASAIAYEVFGYSDGGNFQIHDPTGSHKESQCAQLASIAAVADAPTPAGSNSNSWCGLGVATMIPFGLIGWTFARRRRSGGRSA
ncbi:MAG TPA: hypothetical protein VJZ71_14490 [Phycisphaerae bacterium]|nr:hypothetical protein [Phycisphaerae bacterium]